MNRNPIKQWAITYPQSGDTDRISFINMFPPCYAYCCGQEEHKDGGKHLHAYLKLKKGISKAKMRHWIEQRFPSASCRIDYKPVKNVSCWIDYIKKEDPGVIEVEDPTVEERRMKKLRLKYGDKAPPSIFDRSKELWGEDELKTLSQDPDFKATLKVGCIECRNVKIASSCFICGRQPPPH